MKNASNFATPKVENMVHIIDGPDMVHIIDGPVSPETRVARKSNSPSILAPKFSRNI